MDKKQRINQVRILNLAMLVNPLIIAGIAFYMKHYLSFQPPSEFYEVNEAMRIVQYFLYLSGLAVFFFIDGITHFLKKRIVKQNNLNSHIRFNIISMAILDYIGISGFVGFLISGNLTWVVVFCAISFFSRFRFVSRDASHPSKGTS